MIHVVIMAGGKGERFWPRSRRSRPKQFLRLTGDKTMLRQTVDRISPVSSSENIWIVTNASQVGLVKSELPEIPAKHILVEPVGRNTAPCIGLAALYIKEKDPKGIMVVLPSDHLIRDEANFRKVIQEAIGLAQSSEALITLGIRPTYPATGYGYIKTREPLEEKSGCYKVETFVEKPNQQKAEAFIKEGNYYWNSGMFIWKVSSILKAIEGSLPDIYQGLAQIEKALQEGRERETIEEIYPKLEDISIDYGVMEKARKIVCVSAEIDWNDVGSWSSMDSILNRDKNNNAREGCIWTTKTKNSILISDKEHLVATIGIDNMVIIHTAQATLVCRKESAEEVKGLIKDIEKSPQLKRYL